MIGQKTKAMLDPTSRATISTAATSTSNTFTWSEAREALDFYIENQLGVQDRGFS